MKLNFRNLKADEIDVRVTSVSSTGVTLALYKNARADQTILDETVGETHWQRHHSRDNRNCIVSIYDTELNQWVEKEDCGCEPSQNGEPGIVEKGVASDSFKRACVNWGIGRELYTAPDMAIPASQLHELQENMGNWRCGDRFKVASIEYVVSNDGIQEKKISSVTINCLSKGTGYNSIIFTHDKPTISMSVPTPSTQPAQSQNTASSKPAVPVSSLAALIADDEVILMGNFKGKKYGDVKNIPDFKNFLGWVSRTNTSYRDAGQEDQFRRLKELVKTKG